MNQYNDSCLVSDRGGGFFSSNALVEHLRDMGEPWPVYYDPANGKYNTFESKGMVYLGWYGPAVKEYHIRGDTRFVMGESRAS